MHRFLQLRGQDCPSQVEAVGGLAEALALQDAHHHIAHFLNLWRAPAVLE